MLRPDDAVAVARRVNTLKSKKGAARRGDFSQRGWLSASGAYAPVGTPELDLCEGMPRSRRCVSKHLSLSL